MADDTNKIDTAELFEGDPALWETIGAATLAVVIGKNSKINGVYASGYSNTDPMEFAAGVMGNGHFEIVTATISGGTSFSYNLPTDITSNLKGSINEFFTIGSDIYILQVGGGKERMMHF